MPTFDMPQGESSLVPDTEKMLEKLESHSLLTTFSTMLNMTQVFGNRLVKMERDWDSGDEPEVWTRYCFLLCLLCIIPERLHCQQKEELES